MNYPESLKGLIKRVEYPEPILHQVTKYKMSRPWSGSIKERRAKMYWLHENLNRVTGLTTKITFVSESHFGGGYYHLERNEIVMSDRLSVITYLHEYAHAMGMLEETDAIRWSVNLFKKVFPKSFKALKVNGHMLERRTR